MYVLMLKGVTMTHEPRAGDRMIDTFFVASAGMQLREIQRRVQDEQLTLSIVQGQDGRPTHAVGRLGSAPLLAAGRDTPLRAILNEEALVARLVAGAPGVVVLDGEQPVGVLTAQMLLDYLLNEYSGTIHTLGDETLGGGYMQPQIVLECACCGVRNELKGLVVGRTMCVRGHVLCVDWG